MAKPTDAQLAKFLSLPPDAPVAALNLFRFHGRANYRPGDPEYGTPEADVTGEEAYDRYAKTAGPSIVKLGGRVVFSTPVDQVMIGPDDMEWHKAAIMFFPTRRAFGEMLADPAFQTASRHRNAALAEHRMLHLQGDSFAE